MMMAAMAKKPRPDTMDSWNTFICPTDRYAPPMPHSAPHTAMAR